MTVPNENAVTLMSWTGAQTSFAPGFNAQHVDHVFVRFINVAGIESPLTPGVHYSVTLSASFAVTVVPVALPPPPGSLKIYRTTPATQGTSFIQLNKYAPETHEKLHDASALRDAEIRAHLAGQINVPAQIITDLMATAPRTILGNSRFTPGAFEQMPPTTAKNVLGIAVSDVIGLQTALNNKANLVHTHAIADVIGLQAQLDAIVAGVGLPTFRRATYPLLAAEITQPDDTLGMVYADTVVKTTQRARNANIATITTATPHNYTSNRKVNVRNLDGDGGYNAAGVVITVTDATHFTYPNAGANEVTTADTNGRVDANGIYQFDDPTNLWTWMADAPWEQLEQRIADQEALTNDFGSTPINAGDLFYATGQGLGRGGWNSRRHLRHRVANPQIWDATDLYQLMVTPGASFQAGISKVGTADKLTVTQTYQGQHSVACALTQNRVTAHGGFELEFVVTGAGGNITQIGVGIGFQTVAPAADNSLGLLDVNYEALTWTQNGGCTVYKRDGFTVGTIITRTLLGGTSAWKIGDVLAMQVAFDEAGEAGTFALSINGSLQARGGLAGFVPGAMFCGPTFRWTGGVIEVRKFLATSPNDGVKRNWYVDPSVGSTGNGTVKSPWRDYRDAVAEDNSDPQQGYYEIVQKRGICLSAPSFDGKKVREVIIRSAAGHGAFIYNAVFLPIGSNPFTRPDAATYPNVWSVPLPVDCTASATLIDVSRSQPNGRAGTKTTPFFHMSRAAQNTAIGTINTNADWVSVHFTGTYAGQILLNSTVDPNTKNWYIMRGAGIEVRFTSDAQFNGAVLRVEGMGFGYCLTGGILVERGRLEAADFDIFGCYGNGIQVNEGDYRLYGGRIYGTQLDNFNNQGGIATPAPDRKLLGQAFGTRFHGCPVGLLGGTVFGDCFSNHTGHETYLDGCEFMCGAKDGMGGLGRYVCKDAIIDDCVQAGVEMASDAAGSNLSRLIGGRIMRCDWGVLMSQFETTADVLEIDGGTVFDSNVKASLRANQTAPGTAKIVARHWLTMGPTPQNGHIDINSSGTVQALPPRHLGSF